MINKLWNIISQIVVLIIIYKREIKLICSYSNSCRICIDKEGIEPHKKQNCRKV